MSYFLIDIDLLCGDGFNNYYMCTNNYENINKIKQWLDNFL